MRALDRRSYLRVREREAVLDHLEREATVGRARGHRTLVRDDHHLLVAFAPGLRAEELAARTIAEPAPGRAEVLLRVQRIKERGRASSTRPTCPRTWTALQVLVAPIAVLPGAVPPRWVSQTGRFHNWMREYPALVGECEKRPIVITWIGAS